MNPRVFDSSLSVERGASWRSCVGPDRLIRPHSIFPSPGSAPGAAAKGHEQLNLLEHSRERIAPSGPRADRTNRLAEVGVEHAVLLHDRQAYVL